MPNSKPPVALIAGPTASGKSALGLTLAEAENGIVINADSAQIYRDVPILSAMPGEKEMQRAEHRLYGIRDGSEPCSAAEWAQLAKEEIAHAHGLGRMPILVGGTGLYLRTLLDGIAPVPPIGADVRFEVRSRAVAENRAELERLDPAGAERLNPADSARTARALEVVLSTGRTLADWQSLREGGIGGDIALLPLVLLPRRDWLYDRCDARFRHMIEQGAATEVERLLRRGLDPSLPIMRAIGVREIAAFLRREIDEGAMLAAGQQSTRRYAKRQYTWFAHQPPAGWPRFTQALEPSTTAAALALLRQKP